jgi:hypothetical protein
MGLVLSLSIVGVIVVALLIYFGLKRAVWKQFETETAGAGAGKSSSSSRKQTLPGANAVQDQKASKEAERVEVLATSGGPSSGAGAPDKSRIAVAAPAAASSKTGPDSPVKKEMWVDSHYCWIVICKNGGFHRHTNLLFGHRIPLGETDAISPRPALAGSFNVQCDECGKEYSYEADDVLRFEQELPETFTPHRLFRDF